MFVKAFLKLFLSKSTFIFCSFKKCCYFFAKTLDKELPFCYNVKVPNGRLAQLGEHLPYKQRVTGSSPVLSTIFKNMAHGLVAQLVRALACHARGRGFEPHPSRHYN